MKHCCLKCDCSDASARVRFFRFPTEVTRRMLWIAQCKRVTPDFTPFNHSLLCENHFDSAQFESHRQDGLRKLRPDAVPMLFKLPAPPARSSMNKRRLQTDNDEHMYCKRVEEQLSTQLSTCHEPNTTNADIEDLQQEIRNLKCQLEQSKLRNANFEANIAKFLNSDQIENLNREPGDKIKKNAWTSDTIQRCLGIRAIVGRNGYEYLRSLNYPLPSYRTLCRRIENATFAPGIQYDVLQLLQLKMEKKSEYEKLCVLLVDEMQLRSRVEYDNGLRQIVGYVSPETVPADGSVNAEKELASHALVFMLRGLTSSWKQTVAYLYTGNSLKREPYWNFMKKVIEVCEGSGFRIQCVTSDMGPANTALWNHIGIKSKNNLLTSSIPHPFSPDRTLYFVADPPHLLKNLWNCVISNEIKLNLETVTKHKLTCNIVSGKYVGQLMDLQQGHELRLGYKLKSCHYSPTQYEKMRVCLAAQFFSRTTAAAIQTCVHNELLPVEALTTAWFLNSVNDWFDAMNSKQKDVAYRNRANSQTVALEEMLNIIQNLEFNNRKIWKPIQTGIQLSTNVVLKLGSEIMSKYKLQYFLTGRLSQDPVENLFSQARGKGVMHPSCSFFRQALRMITIAQFLQVSKSAAYEEDGCSYLVDYLKDRSEKVSTDDEAVLSTLLSASAERSAVDNLWDDEQEITEVGDLIVQEQDFEVESFIEIAPDPINQEQDINLCTSNTSRVPLNSIENICKPLNSLECNALYDILGWTVSKLISKIDCSVCKAAFVSDTVSDIRHGQFTNTRSHGGLTHPTKEILAAAQVAEAVFSSNKSSLHKMKKSQEEIIKQVINVIKTSGYHFPECHKGLFIIMKKFIRLRINEYAKTINRENDSFKKQYGSKTACRTTMIL